MFRHGGKILLGWLPFISPSSEDPLKIATDLDIQERLTNFEISAPASGWPRVKYFLFEEDEYGDTTPHLEHIKFSAITSGVVGAFYGGFQKAQMAYVNFIRTNQATAFDSHHEAKKRLQDRIAVGFFKGAAQLGWRTTLFGFMFSSVSTVMSLYRNKDSVSNYSAAGAAAGMAYRLHVGTRAVVVGGILGCALGTIGGTICLSVLYLSGLSMNDIRNAQYYFSANRDKQLQRAFTIEDRDQDTQLGNPQDVLAKLEEDEKLGRFKDNLDAIEKRANSTIKPTMVDKVNEEQQRGNISKAV